MPALLPLDELLRQADIVCVVLPLIRAAETLMREQQFASLNSQRIFPKRRRSPPIEATVAHLSAHYAEHIHLDELTIVAGLSKFHLVRLFATTLVQHRIATRCCCGVACQNDVAPWRSDWGGGVSRWLL